MSPEGSGAFNGGPYLDLTAKIGGIPWNIGSPDWSGVLDVLDDHADVLGSAAPAQEACLEDDPDHPAGVRDGADLLVVDVAPVRVHAGHAGVGDDERQRRVVHLDGVPEALAVLGETWVPTSRTSTR